MSPIDDELRAALHGRAQVLAPSPDPLAGIERRAQRIQRRRVGAAVAGSALAVAMVALAVPVVQNATSSSRPDVAPFATLVPTPEPSYALDPDEPWDFRGTPVDDGTLQTIGREYATRHGGGPASVTPLFAQVYEPSGRLEVVFLAEVDGESRWGVAVESEAGPELLWDEPLQDGARALAAALPGDGAYRLLVVASPDTAQATYDSGGASRSMAVLEPGVTVTAIDGDIARDSYSLRTGEGELVQRSAAPDPPAPTEQPDPPIEAPPPPPPGEEPAGDEVSAPRNAVDWPTRGSASPELVEQALTDFARESGTTREQVGGRLLYGAEREGRNVLLLSVWVAGQDAHTLAYVEAAGSGSSFLQATTAPGTAALAVLLPARTVFAEQDWLLVVPEPAAGQVLYSADGGEPQPVADQGTEAAVLIDRARGASGDRLLILDGNGDPDRPIYRGTVDELLAATAG